MDGSTFFRGIHFCPRAGGKTKKTSNMMKKVLLVAVSLLTLGFGTVQAQSKFTFKVGGGFPLGDFGDVKTRVDNEGNSVPSQWGLIDNYKNGGAGLGFNLGVQWKLAEISAVKGLDLILSVDGFYNGLNSDLRDAFDDLRDEVEGESGVSDFTLRTPKYLNFPVMLGLNWGTGIAPNIGFFCEAAAGANLRVITNVHEEFEYTSGRSHEYTMSFNPAVTFGFRAAAGLIFNNKYSVELGYYNLGAAKVKGEREGDSESEKFTGGKITPTFLTLRLGIAL